MNLHANRQLELACEEDSIEKIKEAIEAGADINWKNNSGTTPLAIVSQWGGPKAALMLLNSGAKPSIPDRDGLYPLHHAAANNSEIVKILLKKIKKASDINKRSENLGETSVHMAVTWQNDEALKILLNAGADPNISDVYGYTPFMRACYAGYTDMAIILMNAGADIKRKSNAGEDAANLAAYTGKTEVLKILVERGLNINSIDSMGRTGIIKAADDYIDKAIRKVALMGADIDIKDNLGRSVISIFESYVTKDSKETLSFLNALKHLKEEDSKNITQTGFEFDI